MDGFGPLGIKADGTDKNIGGAWLWVSLLSLMPRARLGTRYQCRPASQFANHMQFSLQAGCAGCCQCRVGQMSICEFFEGNCRRQSPTITPFTFQLHPQVTNNYQLPLILNGRERNAILSLLFTFHNITNNLSYWEGQRQEEH